MFENHQVLLLLHEIDPIHFYRFVIESGFWATDNRSGA